MLAFRASNWDEPFWVNPNRNGGRFNAPGHGPVQYWALHPLTVWAEYLRGEAISDLDRIEALRLRIWVGRFEHEPTRIGFDDAEQYGLTARDLISDDHTATRAFGERCLGEAAMPSAIVVPSAALPGTENLVVFGPLLANPWDGTPLSPIEIPAAVVADSARPLATLIPIVRQHGQPHAGYEAWADGRSYAFREPPVPR
jgi:RES domain-containing protein